MFLEVPVADICQDDCAQLTRSETQLGSDREAKEKEIAGCAVF